MGCNSCNGSSKQIQIVRQSQQAPKAQPIRTQAVSLKLNRKALNNVVKVKVSSDLDKHRK